jgi:hypothetical protein
MADRALAAVAAEVYRDRLIGWSAACWLSPDTDDPLK